MHILIVGYILLHNRLMATKQQYLKPWRAKKIHEILFLFKFIFNYKCFTEFEIKHNVKKKENGERKKFNFYQKMCFLITSFVITIITFDFFSALIIVTIAAHRKLLSEIT
jgi:hypothetical protein